MGAILSPGKRTVSSVNILGIGQHGDFAVYHHVLNRAQWSPLQLSRALLLLVAGRLGSTEPFGIDETVERRWGRKIAAKGRYRDPVRSKDDQVVMTPGLQWVSLMLLTRIGWAGRHWALPFLIGPLSAQETDAGLPAPLAFRWRLTPRDRLRKDARYQPATVVRPRVVGARSPRRCWTSYTMDPLCTKAR